METILVTHIKAGFYCRITGKIMIDPVISATNGLSYEKHAIINKTERDVLPPFLIPNIALREIIHEAVIMAAGELKEMVEKAEAKADAMAVAIITSGTATEDRMCAVRVQTLMGYSFTIHCPANATIECLKMLISDADKSKPPSSIQRLIFNGRQLEDQKTLADYKITNGSKVHLVFRLRACMLSPLHHDLLASWNTPHHLLKYVITIMDTTLEMLQQYSTSSTTMKCSGGGGGGGGGDY